MNKVLSQETHVAKGIDPVSNAFAGTVTSDVMLAANCHSVTFYIYKGVGASGTTLCTVEACDDTSATNTSAIAFYSRLTSTSDTWGALTARTSAGFTTTAGSSQMYEITVDSDAIAASGYKYVRLKMVEQTANSVVGAVWGVLNNLRYPRAVTATQI